MKTGTIRYSVRERGRKYRGQERNFDTVALASLINGPEVQERVRNRDLVGYFGHWPRIVFGMNPGEGGMHQGKHVPLEAAIVTTKLSANPDGTIEHETEFLDTAPGRTAKRLFNSKTGGFSSAINCREYGGRDVPLGFHGFDYVMEPNFTTNRGYALDGVFDDGAFEGAALDAALGDNLAAVKVLDGLYSRLQADHATLTTDFDRMVATVARQAGEIEELMGMVMRQGPDAERSAKATLARLDSAGTLGRAAPRASPLERMAAEFKTVDLPGFDEAPRPAESALQRQLGGLLNVGVRALMRR